jgi:hypothetical protein
MRFLKCFSLAFLSIIAILALIRLPAAARNSIAHLPASMEQQASAPARAHSSPRAAAGIPLTSCETIHAPGSYYLKNDVTCVDTGFAINADNVHLNLNGHTIVYGSKDKVVPAISICDRWFKLLSSVPCGDSKHNHPEVFNGRIVQAKDSHAFTHAVWIGQANGLSGGYLHDLEITIQETGTQAIHGEYPAAGWRIQDNTINDNVTNIQALDQGPLSARSHFQGYAIWLDNGANSAGPGDTISGNKVNGSPQGGIFDSNQNTRIFKNIIHLTSYYSNDYGVIVTADRQRVYDNIIDGRGRGIDAESSNFILSTNNIHVHEEANNSEYHGCELNGTYGIRVKNYGGGTPPSSGWLIDGNAVLVEAPYCGARAMQFTDLDPGVQGTVRSNFFKAIPGKQADYALGFTGVNQSKIEFAKNTFTASTCVLVGNDGTTDGANVSIQAGQTWYCAQNTVHDTDLTGAGGGSYPQSVTIMDTIPKPNVLCGPNAMSTVRIGAFTKQCGR